MRKTKLYLFLSNLLMIIGTYSVYIFNNHYSEDSFEAMRDIGALATVNLRNGRLVHFFLYKFFDLINFNILSYQKIIQLIITLVIAIGISAVAICFYKTLDDGKMWQLVVIDVALLFLVLNPCFSSGWYYWPETSLGASLSMMVTFLAIIFWCKKEEHFSKLVLSFVFLCLAISMYQVYVEIYVGICLAFSLFKHKFRVNIQLIKEYFLVIVFGGVSSVGSILLMSVVQRLGLTYVDGRSATSSIDTILKNIVQVLAEQDSILLNMSGLMISGLFICMILIPIIVTIIFSCKRKIYFSVWDILFVVVVIISIYILAFIPNIIAGSVWLAPRTYIGIFTIPIIFILWSLMVVDRKEIIEIPLVVMLFLSAIRIQQIECNTIVSNRMDFNEIGTITYLIEDYENRTGVEVDTVCYRYDDNISYVYKEVEYQVYDNNVRGMAYSWCFENMIRYLWRDNINITNMSDEEYALYFSSDSWNAFQPTKQLYIQDNVAYFVIY